MFQYRCDKNHWWTDCSPEKPIFICCEQINSPKTGTKMCCLEKSIFGEAWSPEKTSQSFPPPVFGLAVLYPTKSEMSRFWYIKTRGIKIDIENTSAFFFLPFTTGYSIFLLKKKNTLQTRKASRQKTCVITYMFYSALSTTPTYICHKINNINHK